MFVYIFKELNKKTNKAYTTVLNYVQTNDDNGKTKLHDRVEYLQKNNYINEATEEQISMNGTAMNVTVDNVLDTVAL